MKLQRQLGIALSRRSSEAEEVAIVDKLEQSASDRGVRNAALLGDCINRVDGSREVVELSVAKQNDDSLEFQVDSSVVDLQHRQEHRRFLDGFRSHFGPEGFYVRSESSQHGLAELLVM